MNPTNSRPKSQTNRQLLITQTNTKSRKAKRFQSTEDKIVFKPSFVCPFPSRYRTQFRVAIQGNIVAASSPAIYSANSGSLYHPFAGGAWPGVVIASTATLSPSGFSNLCAFAGPYAKYRVFGSKIRVRMIPSQATDIVTFCVGIPNQNFSSVSDGLAERGTRSTIAQSGATLQTISHSMKVAKSYGISEQAVQDDVIGVYSANYNATPSQYLTWCVGWTTSNGGTLGGAMSYEVEIIFDAELWSLQTGYLLDD